MTGWSYFAQKIQHLFHRGDFKDDKMFANPNVSKKKLTVALWCTFVPRDFERVLEPRRFRLRQTAERATGAFIVAGLSLTGLTEKQT